MRKKKETFKLKGDWQLGQPKCAFCKTFLSPRFVDVRVDLLVIHGTGAGGGWYA